MLNKTQSVSVSIFCRTLLVYYGLCGTVWSQIVYNTIVWLINLIIYLILLINVVYLAF